MNRKPLTDRDGEVRELTREDMKMFRSAGEILPKEFLSILPKSRQRLERKSKTETVAVEYSDEVLEYFRSTGAGWQARMDAVLKEWVETRRNGT